MRKVVQIFTVRRIYDPNSFDRNIDRMGDFLDTRAVPQ
jgi:hypothetical protein